MLKTFISFGVGILLLGRGPVLAETKVDFDRDIKPIFASRCYECHGEKKQKSGIRFDKKSSVFEGGDEGKPLVIPGKSAESILLQRVTTDDEDEIMPPKGERLSAEQLALLRTWIDGGAAWPEEKVTEKKHWAYEKPSRPALPKIGDKKRPQNSIDYFVLERLDREKLKPSAEAERAVLLRRLTLDLIGLPPTPDEVDRFVADKSPDAYEKAVDRLLASSHYGERWARLWLDLARYADTQGYEKDDRRSIWPYRDWVIDAINRDLPFDQFTIDQLAGDLLPDATREQKVATGFHRNTLTNTEGGTDDEEFRHEAIVDRVNTTMSVWMGSTFMCAQCHNHKYDPFTMREYYQFYALLNQTADADRPDETPLIKLPTPKQEADLARIGKDLSEAEAEYKAETPEIKTALAKWEEQTQAELDNWKFIEAREARSDGGATLTQTNDHSIIAGGTNAPNDVYTIVATTGLKQITGVRLEVMPDASMPQKSVGRQSNGRFVLTGFEVAWAPRDNPEAREQFLFSKAEADYNQENYHITNVISGIKTHAGWATGAHEEKGRVERVAWFSVSNRVEIPEGAILTVTLRHDSKWADANLGRFRLSVTGMDSVTAPPKVPEKIRALLVSNERSEKETKEIDRHFRTIAPELKGVRDEVAALKKKQGQIEAAIPRSPVMEAMAKPRDTHILIRGGFLSKGDKIGPGFPAVIGGNPKESSDLTRLDLARWLVSEENPLTARVTVNRIWEQYFGIGLVETSEDFGTQGEAPSHPQLLDWLATELIAQRWSLKALHKTIVMSATYRQNSKPTPELLERDPYNRLLARGPRMRLEAEMIRDQALAVSGLLSRKLGGPSVFPPQPEGLWQVVYSGDAWNTSKGEDRYRRGIYTFWRRTMPHPAMVTFDAPSREFCVVKRSRSNTPLQALNLLNDAAYIEAARALARRMLSDGGHSDEARAAYGLRLCVARKPAKSEVARLTALYREQLAHFQNDSDDARKLAGEKYSAEEAASLAAWTVVANVLLNLDELITKG